MEAGGEVKTEGGGARAMAVFDVPAAPDAVWAAVRDLPKYPSLVSGVLNVQVSGCAHWSVVCGRFETCPIHGLRSWDAGE